MKRRKRGYKVESGSDGLVLSVVTCLLVIDGLYSLIWSGRGEWSESDSLKEIRFSPAITSIRLFTLYRGI